MRRLAAAIAHALLLVAIALPAVAQPRPQAAVNDATEPGDAALAEAAVAELAALLERGPEAFETARLQLVDPALDAATRARAAWLLGESGTVDDCALLATISAPQPETAEDVDGETLEVDRSLELALAGARGRCGDPSTLIGLLTDPDPIVQLKAATSLGILDVRSAADPTFLLLDDPDLAEHRAFVIVALAMMQEPAALELMPPLLRSRAARPYAAVALGRNGDDSVTFDLRFLTEQPDPILRQAAAQVLVSLAAPGTDDILRQLSDDPSPRVASWAAREVRRWGRPRTLSRD